MRSLLTGVGVGVIAGPLVHQLFQHGLALGSWSVRDPQTSRMILMGAVIGAVCALVMPGSTRR